MITRLPVWSRVAIRPSDAPAAELPDAEPTPADLAALETGDDRAAEVRIGAALELAAYDASHRELMALRDQLPAALDEYEDDTDDVVEVVDFAPARRTAWRAAA